jgi:hypothetical protein
MRGAARRERTSLRTLVAQPDPTTAHVTSPTLLRSNQSHSKAVQALQTYGLCVLPGLHEAGVVEQGGKAALLDLAEAKARLADKGVCCCVCFGRDVIYIY